MGNMLRYDYSSTLTFFICFYLVLFVPYGTYSWNSRLQNITFLSNSLSFSPGGCFIIYFCSSFNRVLQLAVCRSSLSYTSLWVPFESVFCYSACGFPCKTNPLQRTFNDLFNYWVLFCSNIEVFVTNCLRPPYLTYKAKTLVDTWILCWGSLIPIYRVAHIFHLYWIFRILNFRIARLISRLALVWQIPPLAYPRSYVFFCPAVLITILLKYVNQSEVLPQCLYVQKLLHRSLS